MEEVTTKGRDPDLWSGPEVAGIHDVWKELIDRGPYLTGVEARELDRVDGLADRAFLERLVAHPEQAEYMIAVEGTQYLPRELGHGRERLSIAVSDPARPLPGDDDGGKYWRLIEWVYEDGKFLGVSDSGYGSLFDADQLRKNFDRLGGEEARRVVAQTYLHLETQRQVTEYARAAGLAQIPTVIGPTYDGGKLPRSAEVAAYVKACLIQSPQRDARLSDGQGKPQTRQSLRERLSAMSKARGQVKSEPEAVKHQRGHDAR